MTIPVADNSSDPLLPTEDHESVDNPDKNEAALFPIVGVGASAGGLDAFTQFLRALPNDTGMAFVLVQHLAPTHTSALAEILSRATRMLVTEVQGESPVEPNHVYVIPPGRSMVIAAGTLQLLPREGFGLHRPIDQFFRALAHDRGHRAIGVVLSGTASDGTLGLEAIKAEGGITFAQDSTAQHDGMPHSAIASGCVDFVLPPAKIAEEIVRIGQHPYAVAEALATETTDKPNLAQIVQILHDVTGVDFTHYKFNTLYRRVTRRMVFQKMDGLTEYAEYLRQTPAEVEALYQDILISVTSFFRDPESFEALKAIVFPRLLKDRSRHDPVRLWTLGCSTGQEAYSLAMAFTEAAEAAGSSVTFQLFATDLNPTGIEKARAGLYSKDVVQDVSPERLRRFFTEEDGNYRISKTIRDACIFSRHNVLADPPFSRIDLISCRNLLIYLEPVLQQRILPTLHYALKPGGCLWLGGSETIGSFRNLFDADDIKHKIYTKKPGSSPENGNFPLQNGGTTRSQFIPIVPRLSDATDLPREADRVLLTKFAPPGVLVTAELDILQYRGDTGPFLAPLPGKASLSLMKMLREGLLVGVRSAVLRAGKEEAPVREEGFRVKSNGVYRDVAIEVIPIKGHGGKAGGFLVLFEEGSHHPARDLPGAPQLESDNEAAAAEIARLTQELAATRDYLQSVIEQQEVANEELQSANEEVQSANEELQSTNEEIETSKEEIQSSNEELATVNDELINRIAESNRVNNDLINLIESVEMAIVMLGPELRVRRFTPLAEKLLNLIPTDVGRPLADIKLNLENLPDLEPLLAQVLSTLTPQEHDVRDKQGRWYSLRLRPYRTSDGKIDGVVVLLVDMDVLKRAQAYTESIIATVHEPLLVLDASLRVRTASRAFCENFRVSSEETVGKVLFELGNHQWDIPELRRRLAEILQLGNEFNGFEVEHEFDDLGKRTMILNARRLQTDGPTPSILLALEDITERKRAEIVLQANEERFRALFNSAPMAVYVCDRNAVLQQFNARAAELWGREPTCGVEKHCGSMRLWRPDGTLLPHEQCPVVDVLKTGLPADNLEVVIERPDGTRLPVLVNIAALKDGCGEILGSVTSFIDISERKRAEVALQLSEVRYRRLFEMAKDGILILDAATQKITHVNPFLLSLLGYSTEQFLGKELWEIGFVRDKQASLSAIEKLSKTGSIRYESLPLEDKHGGLHPVEMVANVYDEGSHRVIQCNIRDISERNRLESLLRGQAAQLSDLHRRKDEFLAMLSHELRGPLAPIANAVQLLGLQKGTESPVHQKARAIIERQIGQLEHLVDDLLEVSRITTGRVQLRHDMVNLTAVANGAVETVRPLVDRRQHELKVKLPAKPIWMLADAARLEQVIVNLLTNAVKYTEPGGHIWLNVEEELTNQESTSATPTSIVTESSMQQPAQIVIRVRDTGVGISPALLPQVFDLFTQAERSLDRSQGGLGIGLALVQRLTELHGGKVEAFSTLGQGSEFVVRLPAMASDVPHPPLPSREIRQPTTRPLRVVVVDDNTDTVLSLSLLLESLGHEVRTAHDGPMGIQVALDHRPDVVMLDIGLPGLNGYEVARRIRQEPTLANVVLVALTGYGHEIDRNNSRQAGFNHHLVKPTDFKKLHQILAIDLEKVTEDGHP